MEPPGFRSRLWPQDAGILLSCGLLKLLGELQEAGIAGETQVTASRAVPGANTVGLLPVAVHNPLGSQWLLGPAAGAAGEEREVPLGVWLRKPIASLLLICSMLSLHKQWSVRPSSANSYFWK